jgi:hypothetical protein
MVLLIKIDVPRRRISVHVDTGKLWPVEWEWELSQVR